MRRIDIFASAPDEVRKERILVPSIAGEFSVPIKSNGHVWKSEPFRGLQFFDFEHAPVFHGRTKTVCEVLDALNEQASAKKPFVLVLGASGSGKSSLVRAGVLPLLTEVGTVTSSGPWRRAITRPGSGGDPFEALACALLADPALPELQEQEPREGWRKMAGHLREDPDSIALRIKDLLGLISAQRVDCFLIGEEDLSPASGRCGGADLARPRELQWTKPKAQLALFVDQLEDLFTGGFSLEVQQRYIAAIAALVRCQVHVIAALRGDFYVAYQRFPELVALTSPSGRFDLQSPSREELRRIIRSPAEASGLGFEQDLKTGQTLDEALADAALASTDPLPVLEHLLLQLYRKQAERKDGLLRWADYRDLHEFEGALTYHAERVFSGLNSNARQAFDFVMRRLVSLEPDGEACSRGVAYRDLVASCEGDSRFRADAKTLVDAMVKEGLFSAAVDHKQEVIINVAHPALLQKWPRVRDCLIEDQEFLRMRDRVNGCLKLWLKRGHRREDLLSPGHGLADGATLLDRFHASLSDAQIEYIQKSLGEQKRSRRITHILGLPVLVALTSLAAVAGVHWFSAQGDRATLGEYRKLERKITELMQTDRGGKQAELKLAQQTAEVASSQRSALETQLKQMQDKWQLAQQNAELVSTERSAVLAELKQSQDKLQQAAQTADMATTQRSALEAQLKQSQDKLQQAERTGDLAATQRSALEAQLNQSQDKLQQVEQTADLAATQRTALEAQLKQSQDKLQQVEQTADLAATQRSALEAQLKQSRDKLQQVEQTADQAATQRSALEAQLKQSQDKLQQVEQTADQAATQRSALEAELKQSQDRLQQAAQTADQAATQRSALEAQLKQSQDKLQQVEQTADQATMQRSALEAQLKQAQDKVLQAEKTAKIGATQRSALEAQLKQSQDRLQQAEQTADQAATQRSALEAQLKQAQDKAQQAEQTADLAATQRSALEAQLKQAQDKAQQAEQTADLAATQRSALEAQLKQSQDRLQQAEQTAEIASTQRSTLAAQLKKAEEDVQLLQQRADLATTQRSAMEVQLKKAGEKAQLAQKIADLIAGQAGPEEVAPSKGEPARKNSESANQLRSGRALPLDAGQNLGLGTSTQPLTPPVQSANH